MSAFTIIEPTDPLLDDEADDRRWRDADADAQHDTDHDADERAIYQRNADDLRRRADAARQALRCADYGPREVARMSDAEAVAEAAAQERFEQRMKAHLRQPFRAPPKR